MQTNKETIVFIVDDSRTVRSMLRGVLEEQMSFVIYEAECGEDALKLCQTIHPDAILLDVEMPGMGGYATCEKIRAISGIEHVPIMMVTGAEDIDSINKAYQVGATDFTTKPINWDNIGYRVRYMVRTNHDYLELRKTKQDLNELNLKLEGRVIERTNQLKLANQELERMLNELKSTQAHLIESEKLASLGSLVAGVAHEVNTPIGIAVTAVSIMNQKISQIQDIFSQNKLKRSDFSTFLKSIYEASQITETNLQHAVKLMKSFKKTSADQISETQHEFNLKEYLNEIIFSVKPVLKKNNLSTKIICPDDLIVDNYPGVLSRVITIFITNSIAHGYDSDQSGTLTIDVKQIDNKVLLSYSDTGKGIPQENLKKIFDPFFTTKRGAGGIGLGLNIAYNNVTQLMAGTITCTSEVGKGTMFLITFPKTLQRSEQGSS